jgi:hypothetical protein
MRVQQQEGGQIPLDPCAGYTWGSMTDFGVTITGGNLCGNPSGITVNAGIDQAVVNFVSNTDTTVLEYGLSGFFPGTGTVVTGIYSSPYTIPNLSPNTTYDVILKDSCGGQLSSGATVTFTTLCGVATTPFVNSFENDVAGFGQTAVNCWIQNPDDALAFTVFATGTGSTGTGPSGASDGNNYIYIETSGPAAGSSAGIVTELIDASTLNIPALRFDYHMWGTLIGTLSVDAKEYTDTTWTNVWSLSGDQGNQWFTGDANLAAIGDTIQLRFTASSGGSFTSDIAIDYVRVEEFCLPVMQAPYLDNFEGGVSCLSGDMGDVLDWTINSGGTPSVETGPSSGANGSQFYAYVETSGSGFGDSAIYNSPQIDISALTYPQLSFNYHMYGSAIGELRAEVSEDGGATWASVWSKTGNQDDQRSSNTKLPK